jgi:GNAT superfamily N-acetyltransferase
MEQTKIPVKIRLATEGDIPFIFSSWLRSYKSATANNNVPPSIYFAEHHKVIEDLLRTCEVLVACNEHDPSDIVGYICAERVDGIFVVHYIYVKHTFRVMGIAKLLLNGFDHEAGVAAIYTHNTRLGERLAARYNFVYSPYVALTSAYRRRAERHKKQQTDAQLKAEYDKADERRKAAKDIELTDRVEGQDEE